MERERESERDCGEVEIVERVEYYMACPHSLSHLISAYQGISLTGQVGRGGLEVSGLCVYKCVCMSIRKASEQIVK